MTRPNQARTNATVLRNAAQYLMHHYQAAGAHGDNGEAVSLADAMHLLWTRFDAIGIGDECGI